MALCSDYLETPATKSFISKLFQSGHCPNVLFFWMVPLERHRANEMKPSMNRAPCYVNSMTSAPYLNSRGIGAMRRHYSNQQLTYCLTCPLNWDTRESVQFTLQYPCVATHLFVIAAVQLRPLDRTCCALLPSLHSPSLRVAGSKSQ